VRKLLDKAAATTNAHEADAFSQKAAELVARHRIDADALVERPRRELIIREIPLGRGAYVRGRLALLAAVAEANEARVVFGSTPTGTVAYVAGHRSDLDVVEVMYASLHAQAAARMAAERRATAAATQRYRRSFLFGFADQVGELLAEAQRRAETTHPSASARSDVGLARRDRCLEVDDFLVHEFGRTRRARRPAAAHAPGWVAGAAAADGADVGRRRLPGRRALGRG
jgi:hypothetical protein